MLSRAKHLLLFVCGGEKQILRGVYPERSRRAQDDPRRTLYTNTKNGLNLWFGPKPPTKSWQPWPAFVNKLLTQDTRAQFQKIRCGRSDCRSSSRLAHPIGWALSLRIGSICATRILLAAMRRQCLTLANIHFYLRRNNDSPGFLRRPSRGSRQRNHQT